MRDTLIVIVAIAVLVLLIRWTQPSEQPSVVYPQAFELPLPQAKSSTAKRTKTAKLPSLHRGRKSGKDSQKFVHGVGVEAFVESEKDRLDYSVTEARPQGVRVFVQCMEVKNKKTNPLSRSECGELLTHTPSRGNERLLGRP